MKYKESRIVKFTNTPGIVRKRHMKVNGKLIEKGYAISSLILKRKMEREEETVDAGRIYAPFVPLGWDLSNVTDMSSMFKGCASLS